MGRAVATVVGDEDAFDDEDEDEDGLERGGWDWTV